MQEPELVLDPGEMPDPGVDVSRGVVAERAEVGQVEAPFGLGLGVVGTGWERPLAGPGVKVPAVQEAGLADADADQDQRDRHAHEAADQVQDVLVGFPVHLQPGDVVDFTDRCTVSTRPDLRLLVDYMSVTESAWMLTELFGVSQVSSASRAEVLVFLLAWVPQAC
jgi:hypothetical protein